MVDLGITIALDGARKANLFGTLDEMYAFEQACGCRPEQTFYRYPVPREHVEPLNRFRLIVKRAGLICLSRLGREIVQQR